MRRTRTILWSILCRRQLGGLKSVANIRSSRISLITIVLGKFVIELDGESHEGRQSYDNNVKCISVTWLKMSA